MPFHRHNNFHLHLTYRHNRLVSSHFVVSERVRVCVERSCAPALKKKESERIRTHNQLEKVQQLLRTIERSNLRTNERTD